MTDPALARGLAVQRELLADDALWQAACRQEHETVHRLVQSRLLAGRPPVAVVVGLVYELGQLVGRIAEPGGPVETQVRRALDEALRSGRKERLC